jgi:hypothetical protein
VRGRRRDCAHWLLLLLQILVLTGCGGGGDNQRGAGNTPQTKPIPAVGGTPGDTPDRTPGATPGGSPGGATDGTPGSSAGGSPGGSPGTTPGSSAGGSPGATPDRTPAATPGGSSQAAGSLPTITGSPQRSVLRGRHYSFQPLTAGAQGRPLSYTILNRPAWADFNRVTGRLSGRPGAGDIGRYDNIVISASDGDKVATLDAFSVTVVATAPGAATLTWHAPTENADGSPIGTDLAGFRIHWGMDRGELTESVTLDNPGISTYTVEHLTPGTYYFVLTAFNARGAESDPSNAASKNIKE